MPIGETDPTIAELKGNTILELFKNGFNTLRDAIFRKQNKLVAGDNIVIDEDTNTISAIVGGEPVLDDYYTKTEVDGIVSGLEDDIGEKADAVNTYDKEEVDDLLADKVDTTDVYDKTEVYTTVEVNSLLSDKQDNLTAGTNISISENVISANDTTYTAGTNVQISAQNVISATDTTYTAGSNIQISAQNVISAVVPNITISSNTPSGGNNGDIWLQY